MKDSSEKVIYYLDELNEDFSKPVADKKLNLNYAYYSRNKFWKISHFFWNKVIALPITNVYAKTKFHWEIKNKEIFKQFNDTSYFIYGNHTQHFFDASMPKHISNKDCYTIVNKDNLKIKNLGWLIKRLGALPTPDGIAETKKFVDTIDKLVEDKHPILIYPEAHIWPYYTKIRSFPATSFRYPVKYGVPTFCFTNTYQKRKNGKVKVVTYIDGPFYPNKLLSSKEQIQELRDRVYGVMSKRSQNSNIEVVKYIKKETNK